MFSALPDPDELFLLHDAEEQRRLSRMPRCCWCDEPIQDDYAYEFEGGLYHEECVVDMFQDYKETALKVRIYDD